jgi:uncharacterized protein YjeT (DUF2065 family)
LSLRFILPVALGLCLAVTGFTLAFRQAWVRKLLGRPAPTRCAGSDEDPLAYALRIAGVMVMAFGVIVAGMFTAFHLLV